MTCGGIFKYKTKHRGNAIFYALHAQQHMRNFSMKRLDMSDIASNPGCANSPSLVTKHSHGPTNRPNASRRRLLDHLLPSSRADFDPPSHPQQNTKNQTLSPEWREGALVGTRWFVSGVGWGRLLFASRRVCRHVHLREII